MQPRRRAVTYGKASRRPISALSPAATDAFAQISFTEDPPKLKEHARPSTFKASFSDAASKSGEITARSHTPSPSPDRISYSPARTISTKTLKKHTAVEPNTLYDVPSSDEGGGFKVRQHRDNTTKRRKITPRLASHEKLANDRTLQKKLTGHSRSKSGPTQIVHDTKHLERSAGSQALDDSVLADHHTDHASQSHPVAGKERSIGLISTLPSGDRRTYGQKTAYRTTAKSKQPFEIRPFLKTVTEPGLASEDSKKHVKRVIAAEKPLSDGAGRSSVRADQDTIIQIESPPKTPPRNSKPASEITTPHQRDLWSKLLPVDPDHDSPSSLNLPRLKLSDGPGRSPSSASDQRTTDVASETAGKTSRSPRRKRIVDTLQSQQEVPADMDGIDAADVTDELLDEIISDHKDDEERAGFTLDQSDESGDARNGQSAISSQKISDSASQPLPTSQGGSQKLTYARQRSYLTDIELNETLSLGASELPLSGIDRRYRRRALQSGPQSLQPVQGSQEVVEEQGSTQGAALRSIHELREAGGNVHLLNEIVALLDDIEDTLSSLSLKRSRLLELTKRLQEVPFRQVFDEHDLELRLFGFIEDCVDPVLQALIAAALLNILTGSISGQALARMSEPSTIGFLVSLLDLDRDLGSMAKSRNLNMSKAAQLDLREYCNSILQSTIWRAKPPASVSPRLLSLQCLEYLVRRVREAGYGDKLLQQHDVEKLAQILMIRKYVRPTLKHGPDTELHLAVSILESCTIANQLGHENFILAVDTLKTVADLLPSLDAHFEEIPDSLRALVLRLYLNLTNNNRHVCETLAAPAVLRSLLDTTLTHMRLVVNGTDSDPRKLDTLILALGLLINLAEWCSSVPGAIMDLHYEGESFLDHFVQLFWSSHDRTAEVSTLANSLCPVC